jgi:hypothetical protein
MVRVNPKFTPDAKSIILLGPGVIEVVKANRTRARNVSSGMKSPENAKLSHMQPSHVAYGLYPRDRIVVANLQAELGLRRNLEPAAKAISVYDTFYRSCS